jgi:hypothetical protein
MTAPPTDDTVVAPPAHVRSRDLVTEVVIVDLSRQSYFGLDGVGREVWLGVSVGAPVGTIVERITAAHEVDRTTVRADVHALIGLLLDRELVVARDAAPADHLGIGAAVPDLHLLGDAAHGAGSR